MIGAVLLSLAILPLPNTPFWFDEVFTANLTTFRNTPAQVVNTVINKDAHPPLYYLLMLGWSHLTGQWGQAVTEPHPGVENALRASSVLTSAISGGLVWLGGGPLSALLLAANQEVIWKAQEARMYPLLGLLWLAAFFAAWRGWWLGMFFFLLLALYTHYLTLFMALPLALWAIWQGRQQALRASWPLWLWLPWLFPLLRQWLGGAANSLLRPDNVLAFEIFYRLAWPESLSWLLLGVFLWTAWLYRKDTRLVSFWLLPFVSVLLWWISSNFINTVSNRYHGAFMPVLALVVGQALQKNSLLLRVVLALALLINMAALHLEHRPAILENYPLQGYIWQRLEKKYGEVPLLGEEYGRLMSLVYYARTSSPARLISKQDMNELLEAQPTEVVLLQRFVLFAGQPRAQLTQTVLERARKERRAILLMTDSSIQLWAVFKKPLSHR